MAKTPGDVLAGFKDRLMALGREAGDSTTAFKAWAATQGITDQSPCPRHGWIRRTLLLPESAAKWRQGVKAAVFSDCEECRISRTLADCGVDQLMIECRLRTFIPQNEADEAVFAAVGQFAHRVVLGSAWFMLLASPKYGNGKTHLSVAVMAEVVRAGYRGCMFTTHARWLDGIRARYKGDLSADMEAKAKRANLLVFDELGVSSHGRDEAELLHKLFDHRHVNVLPTIITTNLELDAIPAMVGERIADRMRQSASCYVLTGDSQRRVMRTKARKNDRNQNPMV